MLVRKVGFKRFKDRSDRQNEVWAGKTVNMASKLAQLGKTSEVYVSDRFFQKIKDEKALKSCGCPNDEVVDLWQETNVEENESFDFDSAYFLTSNWCGVHGKETLSHLLSIEND